MMVEPTDVCRRKTNAPIRGELSVISGCMFSGKTTALLRRIADKAGGPALIVKHHIDDRYDRNAVVTHDGVIAAAYPVGSAGDIIRLAHDVPELADVAIDEAHFFGGDLPDALEELCCRGIAVLVTALDRDSWGRLFPVIQQLIRQADERLLLHAVCAQCGASANRTQRLTPIVGGRLVGGRESYEPRCSRCWHAPPEPPPDETTEPRPTAWGPGQLGG